MAQTPDLQLPTKSHCRKALLLYSYINRFFVHCQQNKIYASIFLHSKLDIITYKGTVLSRIAFYLHQGFSFHFFVSPGHIFSTFNSTAAGGVLPQTSTILITFYFPLFCQNLYNKEIYLFFFIRRCVKGTQVWLRSRHWSARCRYRKEEMGQFLLALIRACLQPRRWETSSPKVVIVTWHQLVDQDTK